MTALKTGKMILGLIFLGVVGSGLSQEIPEGLSPERIVEMFPLAAEKEYEIIPIHKSRLEKRGLNGGFHLRFSAFGENIRLWLNPLEGTLASYNTPVWLLHRGFELVERNDLMKRIVPKMYHDHLSAATLFIDEIQKGAVRLYGTIGSNKYYLQPIPYENFDYQPRRSRSVDNATEVVPDHAYHIIYKMTDGLKYLNTLTNPLQNIFHPQNNQNNPINTVYPEIMVILDYPLYAKLNHSLYLSVAYTLAFFNAVDLKYRAFESPKYRLNIAGIIISTELGALDYTNYVYNVKPYYLNVGNALQDAAIWMGKLGQFIGHESFDASITLTTRPLCVNKGNQCTPGIIGYANVGLGCQKFQDPNNPSISMRRNSGIVHDNADFEGVRTTAHELGHLFGVNHDGDNWKNQQCNPNEGHIMTPNVKFTDKGSEWSYCSLKEFEEFLNKEPTCLFNPPKKSEEPISRFLPGQMMDANEQCFQFVGTRAWTIDESICQTLRCLDPKNRRGWVHEFEAAEGTPCGFKKICLHNKCVHTSQI